MKFQALYPVLLLSLACAASAHELAIKTLSCRATEDALGGDECELRIFVDGALREKLQQDMTGGKTWNIGRTYPFDSSIKAELWDLDSPDADDHLGTLVITAPGPPAAAGVARLSRDGAKYEMTYAATFSQFRSPALRAGNLLTAFSDNPNPGKFTGIEKQELIGDLWKRIENPALISLSGQALCGPSAILYLLARNNPQRYVEMARDLYLDGKFVMVGGGAVLPGSHLYAEAAPEGVSPADWMMAASMRDSANVLFDFKRDEQFAGITLPDEMGKWMQGLLGCLWIDVTTSFVYGEEEALQAAEDAIGSGNVSVLLVDAGRLPGQDAGSLNIGNHWAVLLPADAADGGARFRILSWGAEYVLDLGKEEFENFMWGSVTGYF